MKNKFLLSLTLLMALVLPWSAKAQETIMVKDIANGNSIASMRDGDRATLTVYKRVSFLTSGRNYLIVNSATANSDALALSQTSATVSNITASYVHINSGIAATSNAVYIADLAEPTALWRATSSDDGWTFSHTKGGTTYYIYCDRSLLGSVTFNVNTSSSYWNYSNNTLYYHYSILWSSTDYYITPSSTGFEIGTDAANVYLFEETNVTAYNVTASVSPSGIGRVTGAGQYPSGATCTLTASTNNTEYTFSNWTENGTVVSTNPTYSFTVSADRNVVANFESTVSCPAPSNLTASTIYGHSVQLDWTSEADNFNVRYRTIGSGEVQTFFDGFEDGLGNWTVIHNGGGTSSTDWQQYTGGHHDINPHTGSYLAMSRSWLNTAYSVDNWLITPQVTLDGTLRFWAAGDANYPEFYEVYVSTTGNSINDFSWFYTPPTVTSSWVEVSVDLSSFNGVNGYIALRHTDTDKDFLYIDDFGIYGQRYGDWSQLIPVSGTSYTLTGLESQAAYQVQVQANCGDELSGWSNRVNFTTAVPSTAAPTNLTVDVNSITARSATLSWQGVAANDSHQYYQVYYAESSVTSVPTSPAEPNLIDSITETSYTLTGLTPDTEYHVWVRDYCGADGYSSWTPYQTFTTLESCLRPTEVTVNHITGHKATVTWIGIGESYNVSYRTPAHTDALFMEDFESEASFANWTFTSMNTANNIESGKAGRLAAAAHNGSYGFRFSSFSSADDYNQYLVSPELTETGELKFYFKKSNSSTENLYVGYSTTTNDLDAFTWSGDISPTQDWQAYTQELPNDVKYIAFHYYGNYAYYVYVDDITIGEFEVPAGDWHNITASSTTATLTGLAPETLYEVKVQVNCGDDDGLSNWSDIVTFNTDVACAPPVPTPSDLLEVGPYSAVLSWEGDADNYNVRYITSVFFESFEEGLGDWTVYPGGDPGAIEWYVDDPSNSASLTAHSGSNVIWSFSDLNTHSDDWLVSPELDLGGTLKYWAMSEYQDAYEVVLFGPTIDTIVLRPLAASTMTWAEVSFDLSAYEGQRGHIAFHHDYSDGFFLMIDDIGIYGWSNPIPVDSTSYMLDGLTPETEYPWEVQADCGEEDGQSIWVSSSFTTDTACYSPTGLAVNGITAHRATVSWDAEEGVSYQYSFPYSYHPNINPETLSFTNIQGNSRTFTNLRAETEYGFFLRKKCGENEYSEIKSIVFSTLEACPAPDSVQVIDVTNHTATLSWESLSNMFVVSYGTPYVDVIGSYDFNDGVIPDSFTESNTPWTIWETNPNSGSYCIASNNYNEASSNSTISLTATFEGDGTIEFYSRISSESVSYDYGTFLIDGVEKLREGGTTPNTWTHHSYEVSAGMHTFRWNYTKDNSVDNGEDRYYIDDIVLSANIVDWQTVTANDTTCILTGLIPETVYAAKVQADCGNDGISLDSEIVTFTTDIACPAPDSLGVFDITNHTAAFSWEGSSNSYVVTVRKAGNGRLSYDFEDGTQGWTLLKGTTGTSPHNWMHNTEYVAYDSNGDLIVPVCHNSSSGMMLSESYISASTSGGSGTAVTPDNYLVSPQIKLGGNMTFWASSRMSNYPAEKFSVIVSESGNSSASDFMHTVLTVTLSDNEWHEYNVDLSAYNGMGYVAIRHYDCYDQHLLYIDDIVLNFPTEDEDIVLAVNDTTCIVTGLIPVTDYEAIVQADCGNDGVSIADTITFTTDIACSAPTDLNSTSTPFSATLNWTSSAEAFNVRYREILNSIGDYGEWSEVFMATENTYTIEGLDSETAYQWQVQAVCGDGDGESEWTSATFETPSNCYVPNSLEATDVMPITATLNWFGYQDGFEVRYRPVNSVMREGFEDGADNWTLIDADGDGFNWMLGSLLSGDDISAHTGSDCMVSQSCYTVDGGNNWLALTPDNYLVSPQVELGGTISFWACSQDALYAAEHFGVAVSTTSNTNANDFTTIAEWTMTAKGDGSKAAMTRSGHRAQGNWYEYVVDLSAYSGQGYVAIRHFDCTYQFYLDVDDITIEGPDAEENEWVYVTTDATSIDLEDLTPRTVYEWQVRGVYENCVDSENNAGFTDWSELATFVTGDANVFFTDGNWNEGSNWYLGEVPADYSNVIINAHAIIPNGYDAMVNMITFGEDGSLTIEDGGQLKTNVDVPATVKKNINAYGTYDGNYYLMAIPVEAADVSPSEYGLITEDSDYDLYGWSRTSRDEEWQNYKGGSFNLSNGEGYLYANADSVVLSFMGTVKANNVAESRTPDYDSIYGGWNLYGNPFACDAYLVGDLGFYRMNATGNEIEVATGAIHPTEAFFCAAEAADQTFVITREAPDMSGRLLMSLNHGTSTGSVTVVDQAIIRFGEGRGLKKFFLNENGSHISITTSDADYALYNAEKSGEMLVSFKAEEDGNYMLSFNAEEVNFSYLHLIDTFTGEDVDLLALRQAQGPVNYSFEARTTDKADRFKLVFAVER